MTITLFIIAIVISVSMGVVFCGFVALDYPALYWLGIVWYVIAGILLIVMILGALTSVRPSKPCKHTAKPGEPRKRSGNKPTKVIKKAPTKNRGKGKR